ncbi:MULTISPECIES: helix-turn-helix domain-containing protein [Amycolatopsis]|jgi:transcriptional regulator with XRE-family HTH domain|uniref:helix-turn-helix domain-containing protein n=1 Tax=Amycolatopsis sp. cg13 TaxID=3238807 RepID=UPI003526B900
MAKPPISAATRTVGERVREFRNEAGLSQEQLAELAGVHWTFVSQVERGLRNINLHNLLKFADGLGVNPARLVDGLRPPSGDQSTVDGRST